MSICDYQTYIKLLINKIEEVKNASPKQETSNMSQFM